MPDWNGRTWDVQMANPQQVILEELADRRAPQRSIALTYSFILRQEFAAADWASINAAIIQRWSLAGLVRIKKMAWKFAKGAA